MPLQPIALKRCASCDRWSGTRRVATEPGAFDIEDERAIGICQGGPWDGSERRARSACGRWTIWPQLAPPA